MERIELSRPASNVIPEEDVMDEVRRAIFEELFPQVLHSPPAGDMPALAHYTSIPNTEKVLRSRQLWLSNPLLMNDSQELLFVIDMCISRAIAHEELNKALATVSRQSTFFQKLSTMRARLDSGEIFEFYISCFCEFDHVNEPDGLLSMWRGYGANGYGAAIIFSFQTIFSLLASSFTLRRVSYSSDDQVAAEIDDKCAEIASFVTKSNVADSDLGSVAVGFFKFAEMKALFRKHAGFREEKEWRLVYTKQRDTLPLPEKFFGYKASSRGIEPKLKLDLPQFLSLMNSEKDLGDLVAGILLGPGSSSILAKKSAELMLKSVGLPDARIVRSTIPYRG